MEPKTLLQADYLDIIFDKRNKNYGGYELRKHYNQRLGKAGVFLALGLSILICCSFYADRDAGKPKIFTIPVAPAIVDITPSVKIIPKTICPIKPPPAPQPLKTKFSTVPVIDPTDNVPDDKHMTQNKDLVDAHPGLTTADGDSTGLGITPENGTGKGIIPTPLKSDKPLIWVQQMPQYNGDMYAFIGNNIKYPAAASTANIEGTVFIQFVVNEDGAVSNTIVLRGIGGGCDEEALRIVSSMPKWKPGKQNGIPVKVYFTLPIKFELR